MKFDIYQMVTDKFIAALEKGCVPWQKTWKTAGALPMNLVTGKAYQGVNTWLLACAGYSSPYWLTYKQAAAKGGQVKKGEKGFQVVFWNFSESANKATGKIDKVPFLRYYTVFNVQQCEGIDYPKPEVKPFNPIDEAEKVIANSPCQPTRTIGRPSYRPASDTLSMPLPTDFNSAEEFYSTSFHELAHATGHASRLNRPEIADVQPFGSKTYSREELTAELTAAFLCAETGLDGVFDNSASYLAGWLSKLKEDNRAIVTAAGKAQKAANFILGRNQVKAESQEETAAE